MYAANLVENPYVRIGSYGNYINGGFIETLRIDAATALGYKGPNISHYHLDGSGAHKTINWPYKK